MNRGSQGAEQDEEGNVRPKREDDGEGHIDEQLFEEEVADDDEHEAADMDDEEAKELEVSRQRRCSPSLIMNVHPTGTSKTRV